MHDPFATADWSRHHQTFSDDLASFIDKLAVSFRRLAAIQYEAPWERPLPGRKRALTRTCG